jgi:hypothetical protein
MNIAKSHFDTRWIYPYGISRRPRIDPSPKGFAFRQVKNSSRMGTRALWPIYCAGTLWPR